ncbi:MAG TPA: response regulator transcription factor [Vicinamibacterales bacterium]|jgi:DNA-binding NarL/FixJ family response regulator|nr:response regulator transcription factor [Vicinamibacterales bacterium]
MEGKGAAAKSRVLVVDDHPIVREGLTLLINRQPDLIVCGDAEEAETALDAIGRLQPDILIVDISLNGPDGLDLIKTIRAAASGPPVLVLSMHDELIYAERALRAGASGYIMKQEGTERVLIALRRILKGEVYLSDRAASRIVQHYVRGSTAATRPVVAELSDRELEVFRLIGEGHSTRQIAEELHLSVKTVETYQAHIKEKLSLRSARELVQHAIEWSLTRARS